MAVGGLDDAPNHALHAGIALVEDMGQEGRVAVDAQGQLRQVVRSDREAVEEFAELRCEQDVVGDLAHEPDLQTACAPHQSVLGHFREYGTALVQSAAEWNHDANVVESHRLTHAQHRLALESESGAVAIVVVARGSAEADHRIRFHGLEVHAAEERRVLVRLEVGEAYEHGPRVKRGSHLGDPGRQAIDEVVGGSVEVGAERGDLGPDAWVADLVRLEQRHGVHPDPVRHEELDAHQAHARTGQLRQMEGHIGVRDVEHQGHGRLGQLREIDLVALEVEEAVIDAAFVAFGARDRDRLAVCEHSGRVARSDYAGNSALARDDRCVAGASAALGDDRRCALEDRLPVRVGHLGDQHVALAKLVDRANRADDSGRTRSDTRPDALAADDWRSAFLQPKDLERRTRRDPVNRLRSCLQHVELALSAVATPFDVHRHGASGALGVVLFDQDARARQLQHLVVAQHEALALRCGDFFLDAAAVRLGSVDQLLVLGAQFPPENGAKAGGERALVDPELVGVDAALHDELAQSVGGVDQNDVLRTALGIEREHHARTGAVAADHLLYADREPDATVGDVVARAVGDRAVGE